MAAAAVAGMQKHQTALVNSSAIESIFFLSSFAKEHWRMLSSSEIRGNKLLVDDRDTLRQKRKKKKKSIQTSQPPTFSLCLFHLNIAPPTQNIFKQQQQGQRFTIDRLIIEDRWILYQLKLVFN